jgi:hypothetical protein
MANSASLVFPFTENTINQSLLRAETINNTLKASILSFLLTEKGQRRGNNIGSFLPSLQHKLIPSNTLPSLEKELAQELSTQFPGVLFNNIVMEQIVEYQTITLHVNIAFSTSITGIDQITLLF